MSKPKGLSICNDKKLKTHKSIPLGSQLSKIDPILFFEEKIHLMKKHDEEVWAFLNKIQKKVNDRNSLHRDLQAKILEISDLQSSISDVQVFLMREREENLRLAAENDNLRIKNFENARCVDVLLQLCGINRKQLNDIMSTEPKKVDGNSNGQHVSSNENEQIELLSRESLLLQVRSLRTQLDNLKSLFRNEVDVLLKDREVIAEERVLATQRLKQELASINDELKDAQESLFEAANQLLIEQKERREETAQYLVDKQMNDRQLKNAEKLLGEEFGGATAVISGVGKSKIRNCNLRRLQEQISEKDGILTVCQQQIKHFETEAKMWKEKAENINKLFKEKTLKLSNELTIMKNRYEDLDRRRLLEGEGFRADIKMLRDKLKDLEKKLIKFKTEYALTPPSSQEDEIRSSTQHTLLKAKRLERELAALRLKVACLTEHVQSND